MLPIAAIVPSPKITVVATSTQVLSAWQWWFDNITPQPSLSPGDGFVFDHKHWGQAQSILMHGDSLLIEHIANLYLASQIIADPVEILSITQGQLVDICVSDPGLDPQIIKVVENPEKFPHALSENLAFWTQLASIIKSGLFPDFVVTLPNTKSTDPGPDGLCLLFDLHGSSIVEIRSVKSSINDPSSKIASADFRRGIDPDPSIPPDAQLDEFYLVSKDNYGFIKLERLLVGAFHSLNKGSNTILRTGLIRSQSRFNAMLVADDQYASSTRFSSYSRIPRLPTEKTSTYIGSDNWQTFSENVRGIVVNTLTTAGVL